VKPRDNSYAPEVFERDGHIIATGNGYCITDCPACNRREVNSQFFWAIFITLMLCAILFGRSTHEPARPGRHKQPRRMTDCHWER
jgi:hypothetical protein